MAYAVVRTGGKQYKVSPGDIIEVERLSAVKANENYDFPGVLLYNADGKLKIGKRYSFRRSKRRKNTRSQIQGKSKKPQGYRA